MKEELRLLIKEKGMKATPARCAILNAFLEGGRPMNADAIALKTASDDINLVTIYRTISTFEKAGIVKKVDFRKGSEYYELAHGSHHHHHLICKGCETVESFDFCIAPEISKKILKSSKKFTSVSDHAFELFGYCKKCAK